MYVFSSFAIILIGKRERVALLFCLVIVVVLFLFVCFVALRPQSTAMVIAGRSVHLITLFPGQA